MDQWRIGPIVWGALFIWIGVMGVIETRPGVASLGAGIILIAGALWRRTVGRRAGFILSVMGILLLLIGIRDLGGTDGRGVPLFATAMVAIGALLITKAIAFSRATKPYSMSMRYDRLPNAPDHDHDPDR